MGVGAVNGGGNNANGGGAVNGGGNNANGGGAVNGGGNNANGGGAVNGGGNNANGGGNGNLGLDLNRVLGGMNNVAPRRSQNIAPRDGAQGLAGGGIEQILQLLVQLITQALGGEGITPMSNDLGPRLGTGDKSVGGGGDKSVGGGGNNANGGGAKSVGGGGANAY